MKDETKINFRLPRALRDALQQLADADERTLSNYCVRVLREHAEAAAKRKLKVTGART